MDMTVLLIGGGVVILALIGVGIYLSMNSERAAMEERLGKYLEEEKPKSGSQQGGTALGEWVNKRVESTSLGGRISKALAQADLKFKPGEYVAMIVIVAIGLGGVLWFVGGRQILSFLIGAVVGAVVPIVYLKSQQGKRLVKFNDQLGDMINLMVNGIRAGYSTMQAMEAISRELPSPIADEFRRVVQEMQLGVPMERALDNLLRRIPSEDLDFVITAINVQREVGGPLAEILDTISYTIRERVRIKGEIRVMTAQVMQSGQLLAAVPFVVFVLLWFINQNYMMEFFNNLVCGAISITTGLVMIGIGYYVMTRIADIEV